MHFVWLNHLDVELEQPLIFWPSLALVRMFPLFRLVSSRPLNSDKRHSPWCTQKKNPREGQLRRRDVISFAVGAGETVANADEVISCFFFALLFSCSTLYILLIISSEGANWVFLFDVANAWLQVKLPDKRKSKFFLFCIPKAGKCGLISTGV